MKRVYYILTCLVVILICGCNNTDSISDNVDIITIDFDNCESVAMSDLFTKIEVIELEGNSESYLKGPHLIEIYNGKIYLKDQHAVFVFNSDGKFLYNTKQRRGNAGNEYFAVNDFCVIDNNVCIMDYDGSVYVYDSVLNLNELYHVPMNGVLFYKEIVNLNNDILVLSGPAKGDTLVWNCYSKSKDKIVETHYLSGIRGGGINYGRNKAYITNDNLAIYRLPDNGYSYYNINRDDYTMAERFRYDVGKYSFNPSKVDKNESIVSYIDEHERDLVVAMETQINNNFILCRLGYPLVYIEESNTLTPNCLSFYSLNNGKHRVVNNVFENNKSIIGFDYMDDNCLYSYNDYYFANQFMYEASLLDDKSKQILKNINDETNALIFKYYFRNDIL